MNLDKKSRLSRIFFWSLGIWNEYLERDTKWSIERNGTNICHVARVVFIWMPLVIFLHFALLAYVLFALIGLPVSLFGGVAYGWILLVIAAVVIVPLGIKWCLAAIRQWRSAKVTPVESQEEVIQTETNPDSGPGLLDLFFSWLVGIKGKFCLNVTFKKEGDEHA